MLLGSIFSECSFYHDQTVILPISNAFNRDQYDFYRLSSLGEEMNKSVLLPFHQLLSFRTLIRTSPWFKLFFPPCPETESSHFVLTRSVVIAHLRLKNLTINLRLFSLGFSNVRLKMEPYTRNKCLLSWLTFLDVFITYHMDLTAPIAEGCCS